MNKPRYMLRIEVVEIDADGEERDEFAEYTTELAIEDAQEADLIAQELLGDAERMMLLRDDSSPVTPHEGG